MKSKSRCFKPANWSFLIILIFILQQSAFAGPEGCEQPNTFFSTLIQFIDNCKRVVGWNRNKVQKNISSEKTLSIQPSSSSDFSPEDKPKFDTCKNIAEIYTSEKKYRDSLKNPADSCKAVLKVPEIKKIIFFSSDFIDYVDRNLSVLLDTRSCVKNLNQDNLSFFFQALDNNIKNSQPEYINFGKRFNQISNSYPDCSQSVQSILILPIQRVPRYALFLENQRKYQEKNKEKTDLSLPENSNYFLNPDRMAQSINLAIEVSDLEILKESTLNPPGNKKSFVTSALKLMGKEKSAVTSKDIKSLTSNKSVQRVLELDAEKTISDYNEMKRALAKKAAEKEQLNKAYSNMEKVLLNLGVLTAPLPRSPNSQPTELKKNFKNLETYVKQLDLQEIKKIAENRQILIDSLAGDPQEALTEKQKSAIQAILGFSERAVNNALTNLSKTLE